MPVEALLTTMKFGFERALNPALDHLFIVEISQGRANPIFKMMTFDDRAISVLVLLGHRQRNIVGEHQSRVLTNEDTPDVNASA
jgi:hypothetical protein